MIDKEHIIALIDLEEIASAHNIPVMIIGAGARLLLLDWKHGLPQQRTSEDWDFGARVMSWKHYEQFRDALSNESGPFRRTSAEHRLKHRSGTLVDLVPFGDLETPEGTIEWPESHVIMSVVGFREADEYATRLELKPGVSIRVISIPNLVTLKLVAYNDRARTDDLRDVLFILENYVRFESEERIFDELSDQLAAGTLAFEDAGAFLLGRDIARQCKISSRVVILGILESVLSNDANRLAPLVPRSFDEDSWQKRFETMARLFQVLKRGLDTSTATFSETDPELFP